MGLLRILSAKKNLISNLNSKQGYKPTGVENGKVVEGGKPVDTNFNPKAKGLLSVAKALGKAKKVGSKLNNSKETIG